MMLSSAFGGGVARIILGFDRDRFAGSTSKCLGEIGRQQSLRRSRFAFLDISERWRCNVWQFATADFVGHKVISSRSSSSVQRDMVGLGHGGSPAPYVP